MIGDTDDDEIRKAQAQVESEIKRHGYVKVARWIAASHRERKRRAKNAEKWKREHPAEVTAYRESYNTRRRKEHKAWRDDVKAKTG